MAATLIICGLILAPLGFLVIFCLDHEVLGATVVIFAEICAFAGVSMASSNELEKCTCEETVKIETCEDCGGLIE